MLVTLLAVDEGDEAGEVINPILPAASEIVWGVIAFAILFALVNYVFLPGAKRVMNDRAATIKADLDAAEAARSQVQTASAEIEDQLAGVRAEAASIIEAARAEANQERERLVGRAEREVAARRELAEAEVARERDEALAAVRPQVAELAVGAASKVMNRPLDASSAAPVIDRYLNNPN